MNNFQTGFYERLMIALVKRMLHAPTPMLVDKFAKSAKVAAFR